MTRIFVDTSALLALLDADDPRHGIVREAFEAHAADDFATHGYVVAETIAVTRRRFGVDGVIALVDDVLPALELLPVDGDLHEAALARYRACLPSGTSFVDQVSFAVIERNELEIALALDADVTRPGLTILPAG